MKKFCIEYKKNIIRNLYSFSINYENMKEYATEHFSPFEDYDGEDDWSQDGYMR